MAFALLMSSSVSGVLMIGFFALEAVVLLALVLDFLSGRVEVSSSELGGWEELPSVAEDEPGGEESCLRFLGLVAFLLVVGAALQMLEITRKEGWAMGVLAKREGAM